METELFNQLTELAQGLPVALQHEIKAVLHKMTYPMADIVAKVAGDTLTEKAKRLKVSRQTLYVWLSEKYRPTRVQARRLSRYSDVPIEHILDDGFEDKHDARRKARKKAARVASGSKKTTRRTKGTTPKRRRGVNAGSRDNAA